MNPYHAPNSNTRSLPAVIDSSIIERLITGDRTEDLVFYDVSDHQLYGRKHQRKLTGEIAQRASDAGCECIVYQSVLWWCVVVIPIIPLDVYAVIPKTVCDDPDGDADQYLSIRLQWDWCQIAFQYTIVLVVMLPFAFIAFRYWWTP